MITVTYCRISGLGQERGTSLDTQEKACRRSAESRGDAEGKVLVLRERGSGGDPGRALFLELCRLVSSGGCDAVYCFSPDRLARDPLDLILFINRCAEAGVRIHFVEGPSGTSPEAKLMQYIYGFMGQSERHQIIERTSRGKIATARAGRMPVGTRLFGYDYDQVTKKRTINDLEAAVVRRIFEMKAAGIGIRRIRSTLVREGIPTKKGGRWTDKLILKILKNQSYIGVDFYLRTHRRPLRGGGFEQKVRPREEWIRIEGFTPRIISAELFEEVQQRLMMAKKQRPSPRRLYLLTGFLWCSKCGSPLRGASRIGLPRRYRCAGTIGTEDRPAICDEPYKDADQLEALVWDRLVAAITHPDVLANGLRPHLETSGLDLGREMSRMRREIRKYQGEERRLIALYAAGDFDQQVLHGMVAQGRLLLAEHERDLLLLEKRQAFHQDAAEKQRRLEEYTRRISDDLVRQGFEARKATFLAFGVQIKVGRGKISIELCVDPS